jgi:hypothetical protein
MKSQKPEPPEILANLKIELKDNYGPPGDGILECNLLSIDTNYLGIPVLRISYNNGNCFTGYPLTDLEYIKFLNK